MKTTWIIAFLTAGAAAADQLQGLPPEASMSRFILPDDLRIELVAAEPEVFDPVAIAFDAEGAMYVVEDRGYPTDETGCSDVALLRDRDADGYYETRTVFADTLSFPNGVLPWRNGVLVTCAPHVYYFEDTNGDDRADVHEIFLEGFSLGGSTQLRVSHPTLGVDNWLYFTNGLSGGEVAVPGHPEAGAVTMGSNDLRYNPFTHGLETTAGQAQFGLTFDDLGNKFVCSNRKHIEHVVLQPEDLARNPHLNATQTVAQIPEHGEAARIFPLSENRTTAYSHQGTFTAACGLVVYRGDALPPAYRGNAFVCDPTGNLVHRDVLERHGATFVARRAEHDKEFLATTDNWSRPVFLANGPDGALYVCDMYRKTIEHPTYLPPEVAAATDFESGKECGRIYRIIGLDHQRDRRDVVDRSSKGLARLLNHPNAWHRETAQRLIAEAGDTAVAPSLRGLATPLGRVHALHLLDTLGALKPQDLEYGLDDESAMVREHALRVARNYPDMLPDLAVAVADQARDEDARVRFAAALAIGDLGNAADGGALATIALQDLEDPWAQAAVLSSAGGAIEEFATAVLWEAPRDHAGLPALMQPIARCLALAAPPEATVAWLATALQAPPEAPWEWAVLRGVLDGVASGERFGNDGPPWDRLVSQSPEAVRALLASTDEVARTTARDTTADDAARTGAIEALGYQDFGATRALWAELLGPDAPHAVRVAAIQALGQTRDDAVGTFLLEETRWQAFTPGVRTAALGVILAREASIHALLDALESGAAPIASVDTLSRNRLLRSHDERIASRATAIFQSTVSGDRAKVFEEYKEVLPWKADPVAGHEAFATYCGICHEFQGEGKSVGPNLSDIHMQPAESILLHIIQPNREIVAGYEQYQVETTDGDLYSGIIASETDASVTLRQAMGIERVIPRADIASITTSDLSMMPDELETGFSKQAMRDLIGYLKDETR